MNAFNSHQNKRKIKETKRKANTRYQKEKKKRKEEEKKPNPNDGAKRIELSLQKQSLYALFPTKFLFDAHYEIIAGR